MSGGKEPAPGDGTGGPDTAAALQEAVLDSKDVRAFLEELAALAAARLSTPDNTVHAGVTVLRHKRPQSVASSDATAAALDELQNGIGDGPCLTALKLKRTLLVPELDTETRWPRYSGIATGEGVHSILAIPLDLDGEADAVLNLYSGRRHGFPPEDAGTVEAFTAQAAGSLRLVLKIAQLNEVRRDLTAAMRSRTVIDMAIGAVMAQNRCDRDTAFGILTRASSTRNVKLRDVAASVITPISGERHISTYFDE
ncbi:GAF and ANTAR domain-containing protein [Pseudarthrobacter enclensis]|uniref:GAF and ANTAR domain-containing protein n=1 Tax=Pseudarthrobacter enclensis TaxID=993070 RepID=UPI003EE184DC